jgi:hypothetical protein
MSANAASFCEKQHTQPLTPMSPNTNQPETTPSHRRGKIARLPRSVREQLNIRLDDGQEAPEILPWLNDLPEVRKIITRHFNGAPVSPQNLSAWRQGGFQEWLLHRELLDSASHMCEHVEELRDALASESGESIPHTLADNMVTQLSVRFAAFMAHWDGTQDNVQLGVLLKMGQFLLKLQQAAYRAEREALQLPLLRRKAADDYQTSIDIEADYKEYCDQIKMIRAQNSLDVRKAKTTVKRKTPVRSPRPPVQSRSIKADHGSHPNQASRPESTERAVVENVESGKGGGGPDEPLVSAKNEMRPAITTASQPAAENPNIMA